MYCSMVHVCFSRSNHTEDNSSFLMWCGLHCDQVWFNPFTLNSTKSKIDIFSKITNWVELKNKQHNSKVLVNSFPKHRHTVHKINSITQGFILGVKGLINEVLQDATILVAMATKNYDRGGQCSRWFGVLKSSLCYNLD